MTVCIAIIWAAFGAGRVLRAFSGLRAVKLDSLSAGLLDLGVGLGILGLATLGAGLCGLVYRALIALLILAFVSLGIGRSRPGRKPAKVGPVLVFLWGCAAFLMLLDFTACLSYEWFSDARAYHLGLPERFILGHRVFVMPENMLSLLPLNSEMLNTAALAFGGEPGAKLLNLAFGVLAALSVGALVSSLGGGAKRGWGPVVGALAALSMPLAMIENEAVFGDNLRVFWETLALVMLVRGNGRVGPALVLSGVFMGFAMGGKYLSVARGGIAACLLLLLGNAKGYFCGFRPRAARAALFSGAAALVVSPWLLRNFLAAGDPVYPFGLPVFDGLRFTAAELARWIADNRHYGAEEMTFQGWLTLPARLVMNLKEGEFGTFTTGPLLPCLLMALVFRRRLPKWPAIVLVVSLVEWLAWSLSSHMVRYLYPTLAALCALGGWASESLAAASKGWRKAALPVVCIWLAASVVLRLHHRFNLDAHFGIFGYTLGRFSAADAARERGFGGLGLLGPGRVLLVAEDRVLGIGREWKATSIYNTPLVEEWAREAVDARRFGLKVRQAGIRVVLFNGDGFHVLRNRGDLDLREREWSVLNSWWSKNLRVEYEEPPWTGYVVVDKRSRR